MDIVALSAEDELLVGECKWGAVTRKDLEALRSRATMVARELPQAKQVHLALSTGRAEADGDVRAAAKTGDVHLFGPDEILGCDRSVMPR